MEAASLVLLAVEPVPVRWQQVAERSCRDLNLSVQADGQALFVWPKVQSAAGVQYADGWILARIWLAPTRAGAGIRSRRFYFREGALDRRTENEIVGGRRPPSRAAAEELEIQRHVISSIAAALAVQTNLVTLQPTVAELVNCRSIRIDNSRTAFDSGSANAIYKEQGFDCVPEEWQVSVCPVDGVTTDVGQMFASRLERLAAQRRARLTARITTLQQVDGRLTALGGQSPRRGRCVLFVLPERSRPPSALLGNLLQRLDDGLIPYRRAYGDDPHDYSIPDQLPSILMACGGRPHSCERVDGASDVWQLAIDLGHVPGAETSVAVAALLDPHGKLVHAARIWQPRDETAHPSSVRHLLASCREAICRTNASCKGLLVIRDGRHFERERLDIYQTTLGLPTTPIEFRKRGNPQLAWLRGTALEQVDVVAARIPGSCSMFVSLAAPRTRKTLPSIAKVAWDETFNQLKLPAETIAQLLATSAAAPGLGVHPHHLPGAVYWADGIASASPTDLRFRGVPCHTIQAT
jgi:hypothetical protein